MGKEVNEVEEEGRMGGSRLLPQIYSPRTATLYYFSGSLCNVLYCSVIVLFLSVNVYTFVHRKVLSWILVITVIVLDSGLHVFVVNANHQAVCGEWHVPAWLVSAAAAHFIKRLSTTTVNHTGVSLSTLHSLFLFHFFKSYTISLPFELHNNSITDMLWSWYTSRVTIANLMNFVIMCCEP